jgi:hypothetical protein
LIYPQPANPNTIANDNAISQRHTEATSSFKKYVWVRLCLRDVIASDDWSARRNVKGLNHSVNSSLIAAGCNCPSNARAS